MNTALYLLRCVQIGLSISDLELLSIGMIFDMFTEQANDEWKGWQEKPPRMILTDSKEVVIWQTESKV